MKNNNLLTYLIAFIVGYMIQGMMKNMCGYYLIEGAETTTTNKPLYKSKFNPVKVTFNPPLDLLKTYTADNTPKLADVEIDRLTTIVSRTNYLPSSAVWNAIGKSTADYQIQITSNKQTCERTVFWKIYFDTMPDDPYSLTIHWIKKNKQNQGTINAFGIPPNSKINKITVSTDISFKLDTDEMVGCQGF